MENKHYSYVGNNLDEFAGRFHGGRRAEDFDYESGIVGGHRPSTYAGSPLIWNTYWKKLGANVIFLAYDVAEDEGHAKFRDFLDAALESERVVELTVTDPYKVSAYDAIKAAGQLDQSAVRIGNVNTIIKNGNRAIGYNTDWVGVKNSLSDSADIKDATVLVEGLGGAGTAVCHAVADLVGSGGKIYLYNRTVQRNGKFVAGEIVDQLKRHTRAEITALGAEYGKEKLDEKDKEQILSGVLNNVNLYANATNLAVPLSPRLLGILPENAAIFDTKYADNHVAEWRRLVEGSGRKFISGSGMLYYQFVDAAGKVGISEATPAKARRHALVAAAEILGYKPKFAGVKI